jgi:hypothetical protein
MAASIFRRWKGLFFILLSVGVNGAAGERSLAGITLGEKPDATAVRRYVDAIRDEVEPKLRAGMTFAAPFEMSRGVSFYSGNSIGPQVNSVTPAGLDERTPLVAKSSRREDARPRQIMPLAPPETLAALYEKLAAVPVEHSGIVIAACKKLERDRMGLIAASTRYDWGLDSPLASFTLAAVNALARKNGFDLDQKKLILESLEELPVLIKVVKDRGWEADADRLVTKGLVVRIDEMCGWRGSLPHWVSLLAASQRRESRNALNYLLTAAQTSTMVTAFRALEKHDAADFNRDEIVRRGWARASRSKKQRYVYAELAAEHGITDALLVIATLIKTDVGDDALSTAYQKQFRKSVGHLTELDEEAETVAELILNNKGNLRFDASAGKYRLCDSPAAPQLTHTKQPQ